MGYLNNLLRKFQQLNTNSVVGSVIAATEDSIEEIQKEQLLHGINSEGVKIGEYKNEGYADYKYKKNQLAGFPNVDLRDTGAFYNAITAHVVADELIIESTDGKSEKIESMWSANGEIFGLSESFKKQYVEQNLRPTFKTEMTKRIGLTFGK